MLPDQLLLSTLVYSQAVDAIGGGGVPHEGPRMSRRLWRRAVGAAALSALVVGVPSDVIDTSLFTRMIPVRGWEYPVLALTALLTGAWFATRGGRAGAGSKVFGSSLLSARAVGCPVCNKVAVALLGNSGALAVWAPVQPVLGVASVAVLGIAVLLNPGPGMKSLWRRQGSPRWPRAAGSGRQHRRILSALPD